MKNITKSKNIKNYALLMIVISFFVGIFLVSFLGVFHNFSTSKKLFANEPTYTITWQNYDGDVLEEDFNVSAGSMPSYDSATPTKPSDANYTYYFLGWDSEIEEVTQDKTYTAQFGSLVRRYTIIWKYYHIESNVETLLETDFNVPYGETPVFDSEIPTYPETISSTFEFAGWTTDKNDVIVQSSDNIDLTIPAVEGDTTYYARFNEIKKQKTITWKNYDGSILLTKDYDYGSIPNYTGATPTKPSTKQYHFVFNNFWEPQVVEVTANTEYIATFENVLNTYTVIWQDDDGTELKRDVLEYGTIPEYTGQTPTKESDAEWIYTFENNWLPEVTSVIDDVTYTVDYKKTKQKYLITWLNYDNSRLFILAYDYGAFPIVSAIPSRPSTADKTYVFAGWSPTEEVVTKDATYVAQFTEIPRRYYVTWKNYDGTVLLKSEVEYNTIPQYTGISPTRQSNVQFSYAFDSWSPNVVAVTSDAEYIAVYSEQTNKYNVTFQNYDGSILQKTAYEYGSTPLFTKSTPTRPKDNQYTYTFIGWSPEITEVSCDATYEAEFGFETNSYTVTWQNYDGTVLRQDENVSFGTMPVFDGEAPEREEDAQFSYGFAGWEPQIAGVSKDVTYTAKYEETTKEYTITWQNYDGTVLKEDLETYGSYPSYLGDIPSKPAEVDKYWTFSQWDKELTAVTEDMVYVAEFVSSPILFTIVWQNYDESVLQIDRDVAYGTMPVFEGKTPNRIKTSEFSYTFVGWDSEIESVTEDKTYTAVFEETLNTYKWKIKLQKNILNNIDVSVLINDEIYTFDDGDIEVEFEYGTLISATAQIENNGYRYNLDWNSDASLLVVSRLDIGDFCIWANTNSTLYVTQIFKISGSTTNANGTFNGASTQNVQYGSTSKIVLQPKANAGFVFDDWSTSDENVNIALSPKGYYEISNVTKDCGILANFVVENYTVSVSVNGEISKINYNVLSSSFSLETPSREGYEFVGWTGSNGSSPQKNIVIENGSTGNKTFVANWKILATEGNQGQSTVFTVSIISGSVVVLVFATGAIAILVHIKSKKAKKKDIINFK